MLKRTIVFTALAGLAFTVNIPAPANAAPNVTTKCTPTKGSFSVKQGGKSYTCKSKKVCKITTCKLGGSYSCTVKTTTTHSDCKEVVSTPSSGLPGGVLIPTRPGGSQLAPTKDRPRFPTKVWNFQKAPVANAPTKDKPKKTRPSTTGTIMNTVPMKQYKMAPMKQKPN
jgi:hypothetical protein